MYRLVLFWKTGVVGRGRTHYTDRKYALGIALSMLCGADKWLAVGIERVTP